MDSLSVVLIVTDEEERIEACLKSVSWADEIIVVDGGSRDRTLEIAGKYTTRIYRRSLDNFMNQKNFGIELAEGDWILSVDADETLDMELQRAICGILKNGSEFDGFSLTRVNMIFGRPFRFGGVREEKIVRLFKRTRGRFDQPIHEKVRLEGKTGELPGRLFHFSTPSVRHYLKKLAQYTEFEAQWLFQKNVRPRWYHFLVIPKLKFFQAYILRLGFLDGIEGFVYHLLSAFYYFLKYARLRELYAQGKKA